MLKSYARKPLLIANVVSVDCMACRKQIGALAKASTEPGWPHTVVVAPDSEERLTAFRRANPLPLPIIADPAKSVAKHFSPGNGSDTRHALFLVTDKGKLRWRQLGDEPLLDFTALRDELPGLDGSESSRGGANGGAVVEATPSAVIEVWKTPALTDDYITWAPTPCTIRLATPAAQDVQVTLTNDPQTLPLTQRKDGDVLFAKTIAPGKTATQEDLTLVLPANGDPVEFMIAGKFKRPSTEDKDCKIEVHRTFQRCRHCIHALMVRVRKHVDALSPVEIKSSWGDPETP